SAGRVAAPGRVLLDLLEHPVQVLAHGAAGGLGVAGRDGVADALVLVPAVGAPLLEQQREHHLGAVAERPDDLVEVAVAGDPLDLDVEAPVALGGADLVAALGGGDPLGDPPADGLEVGLGGPIGGQGRGVALDDAPQVEELAHVLQVEPGDVRAAAGHDLDEAGRLQQADRLAHGVAGHPELLGQAVLDEPLTGLQLAAHDHPVQLGSDRLTQRAVLGTDGHGWGASGRGTDDTERTGPDAARRKPATEPRGAGARAHPTTWSTSRTIAEAAANSRTAGRSQPRSRTRLSGPDTR